MSEIHGIHVNELTFGPNARYGWQDGNILEAYKPKVEELKKEIERWGFKKAHFIEYYIDEDGSKKVLHGNRRTLAAKTLNGESLAETGEDYIFDDLLGIGEIWGSEVPKPSSIAEIAKSQVSDNTQLEATKLDHLMVYDLRIKELINSGECKTENSAIKLIAKQELEIDAKKLIGTEGIEDLAGAYKALSKELKTFEAGLKKDLRVMSLSPQVLSWLQESYLDGCDIKLSFGKINELIATYSENADLLLKEALQEILLEPREEYQLNGWLSNQWLNNLAKKIGIANDEKPKKSKIATVETEENKEKLTLENPQESEETGEETEETGKETRKHDTKKISTSGKKSKDYYFAQSQKVLQGDLGFALATGNNITVSEPKPGQYIVEVELPSKDLAQQFEAFLTNLKAAFGDAEALSSLGVTTESVQEPEHNPLDDVVLPDDMY